MRVPIDWLKDFVKITDSPEKLAKELTLAGLQVEKIDGNVLVFEITPNRGDCLSVLGIARELAALYKSKIKSQKSKLQIKIQKLNKKIDVRISDSKLCPRFTARIIDGIKIEPSPKWLQKRLESYGFRPINNIVDITNYVMIETGQPLHAFDYDKIKNGLMRIRKAREGEEVVTLDGINRVLNEGAIVIEDDEKIYDLAGIMGGFKSEVDEKTKTIILQGAIFDKVLIRRASKKLNHVTDASYRYERGVDYEGTVYGVDTAASLIQKLILTAKIGKLIDIKKELQPQTKIKIEEAQINRLLGVKIPLSEMEKYLTNLGFKIEGRTVIVPSWRFYDVKIWQDLAEEVARMYGYRRLPKMILSEQKSVAENKDWTAEQKIKDYLTNLGFVEVESYPYLSTQDLEKVNIDPKNCLEIANPISPETQYLRPLLLPCILKQVAKNPWAAEIKIFEIGNIFSKNSEKKEIAIVSTSENENVGVKLEEVKSDFLSKFKIRKKVYLYIEDLKDFTSKISLPTTFKTDFPKIQYRPISTFPPVVFDLAIIVDQDIQQEQIEEVIREASSLVYHLELFDIYVGPQLSQGKKSFAYHLTLSSYDHTLKDEEIKKVRQKIINNLKQKLKAPIRGESV